MSRFRRMKTLQKFSSVHAQVHNAHRLNLTGESMRRANGERSLDAGLNP